MNALIMKHFHYGHLPENLQKISRPFCELAALVDAIEVTDHAEKATALRKLLEAKDAAVRMVLP